MSLVRESGGALSLLSPRDPNGVLPGLQLFEPWVLTNILLQVGVHGDVLWTIISDRHPYKNFLYRFGPIICDIIFNDRWVIPDRVTAFSSFDLLSSTSRWLDP